MITLNLTHNQRWLLLHVLEQSLNDESRFVESLEGKMKPGEKLDYSQLSRDTINLIDQLTVRSTKSEQAEAKAAEAAQSHSPRI